MRDGRGALCQLTLPLDTSPSTKPAQPKSAKPHAEASKSGEGVGRSAKACEPLSADSPLLYSTSCTHQRTVWGNCTKREFCTARLVIGVGVPNYTKWSSFVQLTKGRERPLVVPTRPRHPTAEPKKRTTRTQPGGSAQGSQRTQANRRPSARRGNAQTTTAPNQPHRAPDTPAPNQSPKETEGSAARRTATSERGAQTSGSPDPRL